MRDGPVMTLRRVRRSKIVATTLTRTYTSRLLEDQRFDTVIIDESLFLFSKRDGLRQMMDLGEYSGADSFQCAEFV